MAILKKNVSGTKPQFPSWFVTLIVPIGLTLLFICYFKPTIIPYNCLGPFGDFLAYMVKQQSFLYFLIIFTTTCHTIEALYSVVLSRRYNLNLLDTILWFILVLIYGVLSLHFLKPVKLKAT